MHYFFISAGLLKYIQCVVHPMVTKVALLGDAFMVVKVNGVIGAHFYTQLTSGAQVIIHHHNAIGPFANGFIGTGIGAGRIIAVLAYVYAIRKKESFINHFWAVFAYPNQLDPV
jgi:hypothetical protein